MKRFGRPVAVATIAVLAVLATSASAELYVNSRYGYSVTYPSALLVPEPESDSADGRKFHARNGPATMSIWESGAASVESPEEIEQRYEDDCGGVKPAYRVIKPGLIAFSCLTSKNHVLYFKAVIQDDRMTAVMLDYPYAERSVWDPVVKQVSGSLVGASDSTLPR